MNILVISALFTFAVKEFWIDSIIMGIVMTIASLYYLLYIFTAVQTAYKYYDKERKY